MFAYCTALVNLPDVDTSNAENMSNMFAGCTSLTNINNLTNYSLSYKDISGMFNGCSSITSVPSYLDIEESNNISYMFSGTGITTDVVFNNISGLDTINGLYEGCASLVTATHLDSCYPSGMDAVFANCTSLTTVGSLYCENATSMWNIFYNCTNLTSIGISGAKVDFDLSSCELLPASELSTIISNLGDVANEGNNATGEYTATLTLGSVNLAKLSQSDIDSATAKGWTLA